MAGPTTRDSDEYEDDPDDPPIVCARKQYKRWMVEIEAAKKELKQFQKDGREANERFRDERPNADVESNVNDDQMRRLNVYSSDTQVKRDELFGNVPKVDVSRRYGDSRDQPGRVAGVLLQRVLNSDIEHDERSYCTTLERALFDVLSPGLGVAMARYVDRSEDGSRPEDVETFYVHWGDMIWSPCRVWEERRWAGFGCEMSRQDLLDAFSLSLGEVLATTEREPPPEEVDELAEGDEAEEINEQRSAALEEWHAFAKEKGREAIKRIPLNAQRGSGSKSGKGNDSEDRTKKNYPWDRAYVWEIWDLERRQVVRLVEGFDLALECVPDPLGLKSFFPFPEPLMANLTNDKCVPVSDFKFAKGLYQEVDTLTMRISNLARACRIAGCYDKTVPEIGRVFDEAEENRMIPVDNWDMFREKGGIKGLIELVPLEMVTSTIETLTQQRLNTLDLLRQITGMADIMKGQQAENGTPGEAMIKFQAASVRMRAWQKRFARFASELQAIKAEIIAKKFSTDTILKRANAEYMEDAPDPANPQAAQQRQVLLEQAVALIRDRFHDYRIQVRPESIAAEDFASMNAERTEFLGKMTDFLGKAQQAAQALPAIMPGMLRLAKWTAAGLKGGKEIEGVFDEMIDAAAKAAAAPQPQQQPNPDALKLQAQQQAAQLKSKELQEKAAIDERRMQMETQQDALRDEAQARQKAQEDTTEHQQEMEADQRRAQIDIEKKRAELELKARLTPPRPVVAVPPAPRKL